MARPRTPRSIAIRVFVLVVVATQSYFVVRGYRDPHKHFAYQPFNESSTWTAEIARVTFDGRRESIRDGWEGYHWPELVTERGLGWPFGLCHADTGVDSTLDFLGKALDWVADHTPRDRTTRYLEARVQYWRNTRGPTEVTLRSKERVP